MSFGIFVMLVIIILELIAVFYMFRIGLQHDAHNDVAKVEASAALQRLSDRGIDVVTAPEPAPVATSKPVEPEAVDSKKDVVAEESSAEETDEAPAEEADSETESDSDDS